MRGTRRFMRLLQHRVSERIKGQKPTTTYCVVSREWLLRFIYVPLNARVQRLDYAKRGLMPRPRQRLWNRMKFLVMEDLASTIKRNRLAAAICWIYFVEYKRDSNSDRTDPIFRVTFAFSLSLFLFLLFRYTFVFILLYYPFIISSCYYRSVWYFHNVVIKLLSSAFYKSRFILSISDIRRSPPCCRDVERALLPVS